MLGPKQVADPGDGNRRLEREVDSQLAIGYRLVQIGQTEDWSELLKRYRAIGWKVSAAPGSEFVVFSEP